MTKAEIKAEYDRFYRIKPEKWTSIDRNEFARKTIEEYFEISLPKTFLDIGCGNGHTIAYLKDFWQKTTFYGFDLSSVAIETARAKLPGVDLRVGFLDEMSYPLKFDCICLLGVAEHFIDLVKSLEQVNALLSGNGIVYLESPNCLAYEGSTPEEGFRRVNFGNRQMEWHLTRRSWIDKIKAAGFDIAASIIGPTPQTEFIFILEKGKIVLQ